MGGKPEYKLLKKCNGNVLALISRSNLVTTLEDFQVCENLRFLKHRDMRVLQ